MRWLALALLLVLPGVAQAQIEFGQRAADPFSPSWIAAPVLWDEFLSGSTTTGAIGQLGWYASGNWTGSLIAGESGHPGIHRGSVAAGPATGVLALENSTPLLYSDALRFLAIIRPSTGANVPEQIVGFQNSGTGYGCWIEHLTADANWFGVCKSAAGTTRTDTGVAFAGATWFRLDISVTSTVATLTVNTTSIQISGANYPTGATAVWPVVSLATKGTAATLDLDYVAVQVAASR